MAATLLFAVVLAVTVADRLLAAPRSDLEALTWFLSFSGAVSLGVGALAIKWITMRTASVRHRLVLVYGVGLLVALANVLTTSALMFLSPHDLALLVLLLAFAGVISVSFAFATAGVIASQVETLARAARRIAQGDLSVRVGGHTPDEIGRLAVAFDQMADELQRASARERALEGARRELITAVSHDLRTPLASTRAMVEALADGVVSERADVQQYLELILRETDHLNRLIDDLFELSQIDSGALRLKLRPADIGELISEALAAHQAPAAQRGVRLEERLSPIRPVSVDSERLQRVVRNLLDNAVRHTPPGGCVRIGAAEDATGVEVYVDDSGAGVAPGDLQRIFERFYRGDSSRRREDQSTAHAGLGLAIARGLVEAHGGRIWAEPSSLGGLSVHIHLPRANVAA